jgi:hypothetical protein
MRLREVGLIHDASSGEADLQRLRAGRRSQAHPNEQEIIGYLEAGNLFIGCPGFVMDPLGPPDSGAGAMHLYTDGCWLWPQCLAEYVRRYHFALPDEFVRHMEHNNWAPPLMSEQELRLVGDEYLADAERSCGTNGNS